MLFSRQIQQRAHPYTAPRWRGHRAAMSPPASNRQGLHFEAGGEDQGGVGGKVPGLSQGLSTELHFLALRQLWT
jgi:hypothetical protein